MGYYTPIGWQARIGTNLNKFIDSNSGNTLILNSAATITQEGTPFSEQNMKKMDEAIAKYSWDYGTADPSTLTNPSEGQLYFKIV